MSITHALSSPGYQEATRATMCTELVLVCTDCNARSRSCDGQTGSSTTPTCHQQFPCTDTVLYLSKSIASVPWHLSTQPLKGGILYCTYTVCPITRRPTRILVKNIELLLKYPLRNLVSEEQQYYGYTLPRSAQRTLHTATCVSHGIVTHTASQALRCTISLA